MSKVYRRCTLRISQRECAFEVNSPFCYETAWSHLDQFLPTQQKMIIIFHCIDTTKYCNIKCQSIYATCYSFKHQSNYNVSQHEKKKHTSWLLINPDSKMAKIKSTPMKYRCLKIYLGTESKYLTFILSHLLARPSADLDDPMVTVHQSIGEAKEQFYYERTVFLRCVANSNPPVRYSWHRGREVLTQGSDKGVEIYEPFFTQVSQRQGDRGGGTSGRNSWSWTSSSLVNLAC